NIKRKTEYTSPNPRPLGSTITLDDHSSQCCVSLEAFAALFPRKRKGTKRSKGSISRKTERAQHASPPQIDRHRKRLRDVINTDSVYHRSDVIALQASRCAMRDLDINNKENNSTMPSQRPTIAPTWRAPLAQMNGERYETLACSNTSHIHFRTIGWAALAERRRRCRSSSKRVLRNVLMNWSR
ncbi:hypothetical protein JG687_00018429, partial [Phytophthora cactorum]